MSDHVNARVRCPFFVDIRRSRGMVGVECEALMDDETLGFDVTHIQRMQSYAEVKDFTEIFCEDRYTSCPYHQALIDFKYKKQA